MRLEATVRVPGTCGELVQGIMDGVSFHISCPIDIYSVVRAELSPDMPDLIFPAASPKAGLAMRKTLEYLGRTGLGGNLGIRTPLPRGKGMASSTADIAGAVFATGLALGEEIPPQEVADIALSIEPTDGSLFPGVVIFDHRQGKLLQALGMPPPMDIIVLDFGGEVDTIAFNRYKRLSLMQALEPQVIEARDLVLRGMAASDPALIGQGATISARANQRILFKPQLPRVLSLAQEVRALGVNVAHSGTVTGVLLDPRLHERAAISDFLRRNIPGLSGLFVCSFIGGGSRKQEAGCKS
jgi:L-threonine kinase